MQHSFQAIRRVRLQEILECHRKAEPSVVRLEHNTYSVGKRSFHMQEHYGKDNEESIAAIKVVFRELDLESTFKQYEKQSYEQLSALISQQKLLPEEVFTSLLQKIYKRQK